VGIGETQTCTITNDDEAPTLKLVKVVTNDDGGNATSDDWTLSASAAAPDDGRNFSNLGGSGSFKTVFANAGYDLAESTVTGYTAGSFTCDGGSLAGQTLTLSEGQDVTCTITNDDVAPRLTVVKHVVNDDSGTLEASDFDILVAGSAISGGSMTFTGEESPGTTLTLQAGTFEVTETTAFSDFYAASFSGDCSGTVSVGDIKTCTITNDDVQREQPSIQINSLSITATRTQAAGVFNITDESESGTEPDGFAILLTEYGVRWEFKGTGRKATFRPVDGATCTYHVQAIDGVSGEPAGYTSGDPIIFDETVDISYSCTFNPQLPAHGTLRGTAFASIFGRPARQFTFINSVSF
jgi:hypothetical protein